MNVMMLPGLGSTKTNKNDMTYLDELHDVAWLEIAVDEVVVAQVVHPGRQVGQHLQIKQIKYNVMYNPKVAI